MPIGFVLVSAGHAQSRAEGLLLSLFVLPAVPSAVCFLVMPEGTIIPYLNLKYSISAAIVKGLVTFISFFVIQKVSRLLVELPTYRVQSGHLPVY